jgi:hypothetical protein
LPENVFIEQHRKTGQNRVVVEVAELWHYLETGCRKAELDAGSLGPPPRSGSVGAHRELNPWVFRKCCDTNPFASTITQMSSLMWAYMRTAIFCRTKNVQAPYAAIPNGFDPYHQLHKAAGNQGGPVTTDSLVGLVVG